MDLKVINDILLGIQDQAKFIRNCIGVEHEIQIRKYIEELKEMTDGLIRRIKE